MANNNHPRPLLLLDLDGVVNALGPWQASDTHRIAHCDGYRLQARHELIDIWLPALADTFDVVGASMWEDRLGDALCALGVEDDAYAPGMPFLSFTDYHADAPDTASGGVGGLGVASWKWPLLRETVMQARAEGRRVLWIDDSPTDRMMRWAARWRSPSVLFVRPDPAEGLTDRQALHALAFGSLSPSWQPEPSSRAA